MRRLTGWLHRLALGLPLVLLAAPASSAQAVSPAPADSRAWDVLAASRFAAGDWIGALEAWNAIGEPRIETVTVRGIDRTPEPVVVGLLGLEPNQQLTRTALTRAERRLDDLPVATAGSVQYMPTGNGRATVSAAIRERTLLPSGWTGWASVGLRAVFDRLIQVDVAGPLRRAELWSPSYRWQPRRPRVQLALKTPVPGGWPAILRLDAFWERQTYSHVALGPVLREQTRGRAGAAVGGWPASWLRIEGGAAFDRFDETDSVAIDGSAVARLARDYVSVRLAASRWWPSLDEAPSFSSIEGTAAVRTSRATDAAVLTGLVGVAAVGPHAPLAIWPGASSGLGRGALLRAHPILDDGVVTGEVFGRRLAFATMEYSHPVWRSPYGGVGVAAFVDIARASRRLDPVSSRVHADIGGGLRLSDPGGGTVRIDVGFGLRDHRVALSAGYVVPWGRR
jgi:hypothetical protein